jgi:hypothetical protein
LRKAAQEVKEAIEIIGGRGSKMQTLQLLQYVLQGLLQQEGELSIQQM